MGIGGDSWEGVTCRRAEVAGDGIVEADGGATVFFGSVSAAEEAAGVFGVSAPAFVAQRNWSAALQAEWQPILVGERFFLAPFGCDEPTPDGRLRLAMEPGNVFGGGDHPTTQLCLELLELAA